MYPMYMYVLIIISLPVLPAKHWKLLTQKCSKNSKHYKINNFYSSHGEPAAFYQSERPCIGAIKLC